MYAAGSTVFRGKGRTTKMVVGGTFLVLLKRRFGSRNLADTLFHLRVSLQCFPSTLQLLPDIAACVKGNDKINL